MSSLLLFSDESSHCFERLLPPSTMAGCDSCPRVQIMEVDLLVRCVKVVSNYYRYLFPVVPPCGSSSRLASRARLFKEYKEVQREKTADPDITLVCDDTNIFKWTALIKGPSETPYEGGVFQLAFAVPEQYPLQPPQVRFLTKIFHPNVHFKTGEICLDILKNAWSPAWTLQSVCRAIIALMAHPEADSPLNCDSGNLLRSGDLRGFQSMAKMYTRLAAMPKKG
uniref:E2 ubiquitin-conjugating enzyme n=1 Tax=Chenopodium quinoa TaxID=63459 RepID=A0A803N2U3_CHEQI